MLGMFGVLMRQDERERERDRTRERGRDRERERERDGEMGDEVVSQSVPGSM